MDDVPTSVIEQWPLARVRPFAANPKKHSTAQVEQIAASIREWGFTIPILVDEDGVVLAGHGRLLAAALLKLATVPVIVARGWSEAQKRAYRVADNKLSENGEWDEALLRLELGQLRDAGIDLELTGFADDELNRLFANVSAADEQRADGEAGFDPAAVPLSRPGDLWCLGAHRLLCGDATDEACVARLFNGAGAKLMVTDPPYGVKYDPEWRERAGVNERTIASGKVQNDDRASWTKAWSLFQGDVVYCWHAGIHATAVARSLALAGFSIRSQIIWVKQHFVLSRGDYHWQHEPCWYAVRMGGVSHWAAGRDQSTVWQIENNNPFGNQAGVEEQSGHGTQKPVECMARPIRNNTVSGDGVYDPFVGSGTTLIAAEMTGRRGFAIDIDPLYVDVAVRRWQRFAGKEATLDGDGRTFAAVAAGRGAGQPPPVAVPPAEGARRARKRA